MKFTKINHIKTNHYKSINYNNNYNIKSQDYKFKLCY